MPNYTKLFNSIVTSTIWTENDQTRIVWITMLAIADQHGEVHASIPGLARISGVSVESTRKAIETFLSPDPDSRTPANEGRRISPIDGGWELLNHAKYRTMASKEDSKKATAERVKRHRARKLDVTECNGDVTPCNGLVTVGGDIAEAEVKAETKNKDLLSEKSDDEDVSEYSEFIERLWRIFPAKSRNRSSKAKLDQEWKKVRPKPPEQRVIEMAAKWSAIDDWKKDGGQFAPGAHIWIKDRKWESEPLAVSATKSNGMSAAEMGLS